MFTAAFCIIVLGFAAVLLYGLALSLYDKTVESIEWNKHKKWRRSFAVEQRKQRRHDNIARLERELGINTGGINDQDND
jgi:hypothetical protein